MHFDLKHISVESIPEALAKVERYRLLNEPSHAESICLDILTIVPAHQQALISLLLARTDQFVSEMTVAMASRGFAPNQERLRARLLCRYHFREKCARPSSPGRAWQRLGRLSCTPGCNGALRTRRSFAPAR